MGAEPDAEITVDRHGFAAANGGICTTLRDLARFGQLMLDDAADGRQVVPVSWIADTLRGGPDSVTAFAGNDYEAYFPGGHYRDQWWVSAGERVLVGLGVYGQHPYVDRGAGVAVAKFSAWPTPRDQDPRMTTLADFRGSPITSRAQPRHERSTAAPQAPRATAVPPGCVLARKRFSVRGWKSAVNAPPDEPLRYATFRPSNRYLMKCEPAARLMFGQLGAPHDNEHN